MLKGADWVPQMVAVTSAVQVFPVGKLAVKRVLLVTLTLVAANPPTDTEAGEATDEWKSVPVTVVEPPVPLEGLRPVMVGLAS